MSASAAATASEAAGGAARRYLIGELSLPMGALPLPGLVKRGMGQSAFFVAMGEDLSSARVRFDGRAGLLCDAGRAMDPALFADIELRMAEFAGAYGPRATWINLPSRRG